MEDEKKLTEDVVFELGKVTIGGDAIKVEDSPKEEEDKEKKEMIGNCKNCEHGCHCSDGGSCNCTDCNCACCEHQE